MENPFTILEPRAVPNRVNMEFQQLHDLKQFVEWAECRCPHSSSTNDIFGKPLFIKKNCNDCWAELRKLVGMDK
jgi:hypothetical protein